MYVSMCVKVQVYVSGIPCCSCQMQVMGSYIRYMFAGECLFDLLSSCLWTMHVRT